MGRVDFSLVQFQCPVRKAVTLVCYYTPNRKAGSTSYQVAHNGLLLFCGPFVSCVCLAPMSSLSHSSAKHRRPCLYSDLMFIY